MSAPIFQAVGAQSTGTASVSVAWPTHIIDDLGILVIETGGEGTTLTPPAGWTAVPGSPVTDVATTAGSKLQVWYKFATSAAEAAVATGDSGDHQVARIFTFRDVSKTGTFNASTTSTKTAAGSPVTWPSVTTTVGETLVVYIATRPNDNASTTTFSTYTQGSLDATLVEAGEAGTTSGHGGGFTLAHATKNSPGSTGAPTASMTVSVTNAYMVFALRTKSFTLTADTVTFNETLQPATLTVDRTVTASSDTFAFNGNDVTLTKTSAAKTLTADVATFTEDLKPANLTVSRTLSCDSAIYTEDLKPANLLIGRKLLAIGEQEQQVFTDDFERADEALDSTSAWLRADLEVGSLSIVSGKAVGTDVGNVYNQTLANNQWAQISFGGVFASGTGKGAAILLRATGGQSSFTGYAITLERDNSAAGDVLSIRRVLNATNYTNAFGQGALLAFTRVAEFASNSPDTIIKAEIVGNTIYAYVNGVLALITTDAGGPSSGFAGIWSDTATISTFSAGGIGPTRLTLNNANLLVTRKLIADSRSFNEDLQPANLIVARSLTAKVYADEQLFSDDFTGAAGVLGSNYTQQGNGTVNLNGLGKAVGTNSSNRNVAWPNTVSFLDDQYAEITVSTLGTGANTASGIMLRLQTGESPTVEKGYAFRTDPGASGLPPYRYVISEFNVSSTNVVIANSSLVPSANDRLRAVAIKNSLFFYVNDQLILTVVNTSYPSGVPAIYSFGNVWSSDDFVAGNYGGLHLAGTYTNTRAARRLVCASASYTEDLKPANLFVGKNLTADVQSYTLELKDATLTKTTTARTLLAETATYNENLQPANLIVTRRLVAESQTYNETLRDANLLRGRRLVAESQTYNETLRDANIRVTRRLVAESRTYNETLRDANLKVGKRLVAESQSYNETLRDANLKVGKRLVADTASYNETLRDANLLFGRRLVAESQTYNETLRDANLKVGKRLVADTVNYNETLRDANLKVGKRLVAESQSYNETLRNANLLRGRRLVAESQTYNETLRDANLLRGRRLVADQQTYNETLRDANLLRGRRLVADQQTYNETLRDAALKASRIFTNDKQTYTLTGIPVGLSKTGAVPPLTATTSTFTLNGNPVNLRVTRRLISDTRSYIFNGNPTNLLYGRKVTADKQTYSLSLKDSALKVGKRLVADKQTYTLLLKDAALSRSRKIISDSSSYSLSLKDANVKIGRKLAGNVQTYTLSLKDATLKSGRKLTGDTRSYSLLLKDSNLRYGRKITGEQASYIFTYNGMLFARGGFVKVWTGSAWVQKPLKVWNGTAWVSKPLKIWTGSTWRTY